MKMARANKLLDNWNHYLTDCREAITHSTPWTVTGKLTRVAGLVLEAVGIKAPVGSVCVISLPNGQTVDAEVVGFSGDKLLLMPEADVYGVVPGASVSLFEAEPAPHPQHGLRPQVLRRRSEDRV